MDSLVSMIVPCYNVEQYLNECVESLISQTYSNLEILLIDDGSTDSTGILCDEWANKDTRIKTFHKKNGGLSDARNYGFSKSSGEYICYIDSDDYVELNYVELLLKALIENDADLAGCLCYSNNLKTGEIKVNEPYTDFFFSTDSLGFLSKLYVRNGVSNSLFTAWAKLGKKEIYNNVIFPVGKYHEDGYAILDTVLACNKITWIGNQLYFYRQRENSIMSNTQLLEQRILDEIGWQKKHIDYLNSIKNNDLLYKAENMICHYIYMNKKNITQNYDEIKYFYNSCRKHLLTDKNLPLKSKLKYLTFARL